MQPLALVTRQAPATPDDHRIARIPLTQAGEVHVLIRATLIADQRGDDALARLFASVAEAVVSAYEPATAADFPETLRWTPTLVATLRLARDLVVAEG